MRKPDPLFGSFFLGGFECTTGHHARGGWLDQVAATEHDRFAAEDRVALQPQRVVRRIVVDESDHAELLVRMSEEFPQHQRSRLTGAVNRKAHTGTTPPCVLSDESK